MHASQGRIQKSNQPAEPAPKCFCLRFLVMIFLLLHYDLHQERRTDTRSGTNNGFSSENRSTVNQVFSFFPTPNPGLLLFLTTCNLELPTDAFLGKRRTIQRSACFTLLIPTAATTNRGFSRIAQGVDRFCSPNRPDPIPYTRYCRMRNCFSITVYVSRVHPSNENQ